MSKFGDWFTNRYGNDRYGAVFPGQRVDSGGRPIVEFTPQIIEVLRIGDSSASLGNLYRQQWAVRTCVNFLALNIAHLNIKSYRRLSDDVRPTLPQSHSLVKLFRAPNPRTTRFELIRDTVSDLAIYMNAYWLKMFFGGARALYRIPPSFVQPRGGDILQGPSSYVFDVGQGPREVSPDQVVHFKGYHPTDPRLGSPVLEALKAVLNEEIEASRHRSGFFRNSARRDGIIERPLEAPEWTKEQRDEFRASWQNTHAGFDNAGKAPILEDGMKWNADSWSPRDSEFIAGREWALDTVATAYQIPLALLGRSKQTATFASLSEFHKILYVDVLGPWNAMLEGAIMSQLVPEFSDPDIYVEMNIEEKMQGDFEAQVTGLRTAIQVPFMSVNDGRRIRGMAPVDNPIFDEPAQPSTYVYTGQEAPAPPPPVTVPAPDQQQVPAPSNGNGKAESDELDSLLIALEGKDG